MWTGSQFHPSKVYAKQDGAWKQLDTETIGSYLAFEVTGSEADLAIVQAGGIPLWVIAAAAAAFERCRRDAKKHPLRAAGLQGVLGIMGNRAGL